MVFRERGTVSLTDQLEQAVVEGPIADDLNGELEPAGRPEVGHAE